MTEKQQDAIQADGGIRRIAVTEDHDAEGHGFKHPAADDQPAPDGVAKAAADDDTEGHMPRLRFATEPAPDEPGAQDAEAHAIRIRATDDQPAPEGGKRIPPYTDGDDTAAAVDPDGGARFKP